MDAPTIRRVLVERLTDMQGNISTAHQYHDAGILRGLLWALNGEDPGQACIRKTGKILSAAGIPFDTDGDEVVISNEWLAEHGLDPDSD